MLVTCSQVEQREREMNYGSERLCVRAPTGTFSVKSSLPVKASINSGGSLSKELKVRVTICFCHSIIIVRSKT